MERALERRAFKHDEIVDYEDKDDEPGEAEAREEVGGATIGGSRGNSADFRLMSLANLRLCEIYPWN